MPVIEISTIPILYYHLNSKYSSYKSDDSITPKDEDDQIDNTHIEVAYDGWRKAIEGGNETLATLYVEEHPEINMLAYRWNDGDSALHIAVKNRKHRLILYLLTQGASVNDQNAIDLSTPLHYAVLIKDEKIVELLIKWDADPNVTNNDKESPITIAYGYKDKDIYRLLLGIKDLSAAQPLDMMRSQSIDDILNDDVDEQVYVEALIQKRQTMTAMTPMTRAMTLGNELKQKQEQKKRNRAKSAETVLHAQRVSRSNPFSKLERNTTKKAIKIIKENLNRKALPKLQGWLEKKKPNGVVTKYQRRWIVVKGAHILWSAKQRAIKNDADRDERKKFNGCINIMTIDEIKVVDHKSNTKFMVRAQCSKKGKQREFAFKCANKADRDFWVEGLKEHKKQYQEVLNYLGK